MATPLFPLVLAVTAALAWAGFDLLRKLLVREVPPMALVVLLSLGAAPLFAVWLAVDGPAAPRPGYLAPALGSVLLNIVANILFLQGMRIAPLSVSVPLLSLTPVFAALLAIPLLGERPSLRDAAGILLVIAGAVGLSLARGRDEEGGRAGSGERRQGTRGALLVALTAFLWSMTIPLDKMAVERAGAPLHGVVLTGGVALGVLALLGVRGVRGGLGDLIQVRRVPGTLAVALVVSSLALALQLLVLPLMLVGTVETLKRGLGNLAALATGRIFFGEAVTPGKAAAVLVMAAGVALVLT